MILLATDVIRNMICAAPARDVQRWLDAQDPDSLYLASASIAQLSIQAAQLDNREARHRMGRTINDLTLLFDHRILTFDLRASLQYGYLARKAGEGGVTLDEGRCALAATAASHATTMAACDPRPFIACGLATIGVHELAQDRYSA